MKKQKYSIVLIAAVVVAAGWIAYGTFSRDMTNARRQDVKQTQQLLADTTAKGVEQYFYDVRKRLETIALLPSVREAVRSESCNQDLQKLLEVNNREFSNLGRIDRNGVFICAVNRAIIGEPASKYGTYFDAIAKDPAHKPVMSPLIYPTGSSSPVVAVHVPVYDAQGSFSGTIGGAVYFNELQTRALPDFKIGADSTVALYDSNLDILYHPDPLTRGKNLLSSDIAPSYTPREKLDNLAAAIRKPSAEGLLTYNWRGNEQQVLYRSVPVIGRNWTIAVAIPDASIRQTTGRQAARTVFATVLVIVSLAVITGAFLWYRKASRTTKATGRKR